MVRQIPHRIEGFLRRACSHGDTHTSERLFAGKLHRDIIEQHLRVRQFSFSDVLARQHSHGRLDDAETVFFQRRQIILRNRIFQHRRIHRRSDQLFALRCEHHRCQHIICNAVCHFCNHIGGSRGNHNQIRRFCQRNMRHLIFKITRKRIDHAAIIRQRLERQRGDELRRIFGHDDMHIRSGFPKSARHVCHFIGGNSARHTKYNTFSVKIFHCNSVLLPRSNFFPMIVLSIADRKTDYNQSCLPLMQKGFIIKGQKSSTFKIIARYFYDFSH